MNVTVPETKIDVDTNRYADSVQLDLKLVSDSSEIHELRLPITITMPIPAGLDAVHLTILHYKNNGATPEVVKYRINNDRTITFTVTSFSDFVFAEEKEAGEYEIDIDRVQNGTVKCEVDGIESTIAQSGKMVKLIVEPDTGFVVDTIIVATKDNEEQVPKNWQSLYLGMKRFKQPVRVPCKVKCLHLASDNRVKHSHF